MRGMGIAAALMALVTSGCATITRGTTDQVALTSEPSGAHVTLSTGYQCTTPCTLTMSRKDEFIAKFEDAGYATQEVPVKTAIAGAGAAGFAGNVLIGGLVGMAADAATGATLEHVPNPVHAQLVAVAAPAARPESKAKRIERRRATKAKPPDAGPAAGSS